MAVLVLPEFMFLHWLELLMWKEHISFGVLDFGNYLRLIAAFLRGKEPYQFPDFLFVLQGTKGCDNIFKQCVPPSA